MDVGEIIESINANVIPSIDLVESSFKLIKGYFPEDYLFDEQRFDRILLYSVLHYTDDPYMVIDKALTLLKPYGKLLLGDLPNINQKGRFLSSEKGKIFEAEYKKVPVNKLPVYKDHADFVNKMKADENYYSLLNDELIYKIQKSYTEQGYDVFILPQPNELPFSKTRHDILICKYD
jgi:SAM-dependent methyltransferase